MRRGWRGVGRALFAWCVATGLSLAAPRDASAGFARGTVRVDVRDGRGRPADATVELRGADGQSHAASREGDVYVASGLVAGDYDVVIASPALDGDWQGAHRVAVRERRTVGVVALLGGGPGGRRGRKGRAAAPVGLMRGDERDCDDRAGEIISGLIFAQGAPAAGRIEVRGATGRQRDKLLCTVAVAGGTADLKLPPGDYWITAALVGGKSTKLFYRFIAGRPAPPLALRL